MSEIYSIEFKNLAAENQKKAFEKRKLEAQRILQTIDEEKAELLGAALGLMEYEKNAAEEQSRKFGRLAQGAIDDYNKMKHHAMLLELFIRDVKYSVNKYGHTDMLPADIRRILKEYEEYRNKRNNEQLEK